MTTRRTTWFFRAAAVGVLALALLIRSTIIRADNGQASPTLSFFSGGDGAHADWLSTDDQPPGDTDHQAIRLLTVYDAPTFAQGYAGILVHHVTGIPAEAFPDSSFWNKTPMAYFGEPYTFGSPRLVVEFQDAAVTPAMPSSTRTCGATSGNSFPTSATTRTAAGTFTRPAAHSCITSTGMSHRRVMRERLSCRCLSSPMRMACTI